MLAPSLFRVPRVLLCYTSMGMHTQAHRYICCRCSRIALSWLYRFWVLGWMKLWLRNARPLPHSLAHITPSIQLVQHKETALHQFFRTSLGRCGVGTAFAVSLQLHDLLSCAVGYRKLKRCWLAFELWSGQFSVENRSRLSWREGSRFRDVQYAICYRHAVSPDSCYLS